MGELIPISECISAFQPYFRSITTAMKFLLLDRREINLYFLLQERASNQLLRQIGINSTFFQNFHLIDILGKGSFGVVFLAKKRHLCGNSYDVLNFGSKGVYELQQNFAIKLIPNFELQSAFIEASCLSKLNHPHIVKCYNVWCETAANTSEEELKLIEDILVDPDGTKAVQTSSQDYSSSDFTSKTTNGNHKMTESDDSSELKSCLFFQYELCAKTTLHDLVEAGMPFPEVQNLFMQLLEGLIYLQLHGVVHKDLKPDNIFITTKCGKRYAKIGDFGLSIPNTQAFNDDMYYEPNGPLDVRPIYMPPEHRKGISTHKSDMYTVGLILMTMLVKFKSPETRRRAILDVMDKKDRKFPEELSTKFPDEYDWIRKLTSYEMSDRPSAIELKKLAEAKGYKIDYGTPDTESTLYSLLSSGRAFDMLLGMTTRNYHRYLVDFFHEGLQTLPIESEQLRFLFDKVSIISTYENKTADDVYHKMTYLNFLEETFGEDNEEIWKVRFDLVREWDKYNDENYSRSTGLDTYFVELREKLKNSLVLKSMDDNSELKLSYEIWSLHSQFQEDGTPIVFQDLELAEQILVKFNKLIDIQKQKIAAKAKQTNIKKDSGLDPDLEKLNFHLLDKAKIVIKLGKLDSADEIYYKLLEDLCSHPDYKLPNLFTTQVLLDYAMFLAENKKRYVKARTYCEAAANQFEQCSISHKKLVALGLLLKIYDKIGYHKDVKLVLKEMYIPNWTALKTNMVQPSQLRPSDFYMYDIKFIGQLTREQLGLNSWEEDNYLNPLFDVPVFENCHKDIFKAAKQFEISKLIARLALEEVGDGDDFDSFSQRTFQRHAIKQRLAENPQNHINSDDEDV